MEKIILHFKYNILKTGLCDFGLCIETSIVGTHSSLYDIVIFPLM